MSSTRVSKRLRLLYLSNAFPPGVSQRFPLANPAGHIGETRTAEVLGRLADLDTVGLLPPEVFGHLEPRDNSIGVEHKLLLWEKKPELWHRWLSWRELRAWYLAKVARDGPYDAVLVRNLTPVFNRFARWLQRQNPRPNIVLILADSGTLGINIKFSRRLRYAFKPMQALDDQAIQWYDACIGYGIGTRRFFEPRGVPWMWMQSAFLFPYDPPAVEPNRTGPIKFGYFGALAEHAAVLQMVETFLRAGVPGTLDVCGFGKMSEALKELAARNPNFSFDGLLPKPSDCLDWAQKVDVLINPRLPIWGLENSFPSKILEFAMTGKAILTTRTGGVEEVLGEEGMYIETDDFEKSLRQKLTEVAAMDRAELRRRGAVLRNRILKQFNWDEQGRRMIEFLSQHPPVSRA